MRGAEQIPVSVIGHRIFRKNEIMSGKHFVYIIKNSISHGPGRSDRENFAHAIHRNPRSESRKTKKCLWLRGKQELSGYKRVKKRFDSYAVTV